MFFLTLRTEMLQFARLQLSDHHQAEDAVQEALEGAMKNATSFHGKAAWRTWVFAILRHKIADLLRNRYNTREVLQCGLEDEQNFESLFDEKGYWPAGELPTRWHNPDQSMEQEQFWAIFELCLTHIPERHARAFMMREFIGLETQEICLAMAVTVSNLNVMLWRARMRLRECLSQRWFDHRNKNAELS
ncbi:sigma-70 family RNA polymerase sigma factor [Citrobacter meridianamericanus]|uniref:sigma-70 family RNA polymerase sigma factor n=1 Tax=Citrobacter meridianamericanus TaxID=2894201 RepID=UPI0039BEAAC0